jgi:hypothetical protein
MYEDLIGTKVDEEALRRRFPNLRIWYPGTAGFLDLQRTRVNVYVNVEGIIERVENY